MELNFTNDPELMDAVLRLKQNPDFLLLVEKLREHRDQQREITETASGNDMYRGTGRSLVLTELIERHIDEAEEIAKTRMTQS